MTDEELSRAYEAAANQAEWYSGNNPGRQARLTKEANEMAAQMRKRGLDTVEIDSRVRAGDFYRPTTTGPLPECSVTRSFRQAGARVRKLVEPAVSRSQTRKT